MKKNKKLRIFDKIYLCIRGKYDAHQEQFVEIPDFSVKLSPFVRTEMKRLECEIREAGSNKLYWVSTEKRQPKRLMKMKNALILFKNEILAKKDEIKKIEDKYQQDLKENEDKLKKLEEENKGNAKLHTIRKEKQDFVAISDAYEVEKKKLNEELNFIKAEQSRICMTFKIDVDYAFEYRLMRLYYYIEKGNIADPTLKAALLTDVVFKDYREKINKIITDCLDKFSADEEESTYDEEK